MTELWTNELVQMALVLGFKGMSGGGGHRYLFEVLPQYFPEGYLTETECILWGKFLDDADNRRKQMKKWQT